jgi:outer membrane protein OmpU
MKKLLIASTALVAAAGMASADITISGHAAAGIYSGLGNKDGVTAAAAAASSATNAVTSSAAGVGVTALGVDALAVKAETFSGDGVYSNAGVDFTMTGATDNGISFSASVNIDAGMEVDTGDFELDGKDGGTAGLGSVSMTGAFGTLTFDDGGIENLYSDGLTNADVSYSTTVGAVALTVAHDTAAASGSANSISAGYTASGMAFTLTASEAAGGTSSSLAVAYALNDTVSLTGETDQAAGAESVQTIGATTTLNGVSVAVSSANNSTWDVDLGYTAGGFALTYGVDETDGWTATATSALGGGATFAAGVDSNDSMYAGVSFAF